MELVECIHAENGRAISSSLHERVQETHKNDTHFNTNSNNTFPPFLILSMFSKEKADNRQRHSTHPSWRLKNILKSSYYLPRSKFHFLFFLSSTSHCQHVMYHN